MKKTRPTRRNAKPEHELETMPAGNVVPEGAALAFFAVLFVVWLLGAPDGKK